MTGQVAAPPVIATGRRGAKYIEVQQTRQDGWVMVLTTRGQRYVVQADSVDYSQGGAR